MPLTGFGQLRPAARQSAVLAIAGQAARRELRLARDRPTRGRHQRHAKRLLLFVQLVGRAERGRTEAENPSADVARVRRLCRQGLDRRHVCRLPLPDLLAGRRAWQRVFKYHVDFAAVEECLRVGDVAAIAVSRPSNPTGNVLTEEELQRLSDLAAHYGVYLIVNGAYGVPFPGIVFARSSRTGRPCDQHVQSVETGTARRADGIVVGPPEIIAAVRSMTAIIGLAAGNIGQQLVLPLLESGEILELGPRVLAPFYRAQSQAAQSAAGEFWADRHAMGNPRQRRGVLPLALARRTANHHDGTLSALEAAGCPRRARRIFLLWAA